MLNIFRYTNRTAICTHLYCRSNNTIACTVVANFPKLSVLKLKLANHGADFTGTNLAWNCNNITKQGVVVLQRFPLVFVYGITDIPIGEITVTNNGRSMIEDFYKKCSNNLWDVVQNAPTFNACPEVSQIQTITEPLHTGITCIDVLTPIGQGQNMLVINGNERMPKDNVASSLFHTIVSRSCNSKVETSSVTRRNMKCVYLSDTSRKLPERLVSDSVIQLPNLTDESTDSTPEVGIQNWLWANIACSIGNSIRSQHMDSTVILDFDLKLLERFWKFSTECMLKYVYNEEGNDNPNLYDAAADNSEKRKYYASLFQQVGRLNEAHGGGSMSLLCVAHVDVNNHTIKDASNTTRGEYSMEDFAQPSYPLKLRNRIELLANKGIKITDEVLKKLNLPLPGASIVRVPKAIDLNYVTELTSLTDGQIVLEGEVKATESIKFNTTLLSPPLVPNKSLSRVGDHTKKKIEHDISVIRDLTKQLRFELSQANDIMETDLSVTSNMLRVRALSWMSVLFQYEEKSTETNPIPAYHALEVRSQVVLLMAVESGIYDRYVLSKIPQINVQQVDRNYWSEVKSLLFLRNDISLFNKYLIDACEKDLFEQFGEEWLAVGLNSKGTLSNAIRAALIQSLDKHLKLSLLDGKL